MGVEEGRKQCGARTGPPEDEKHGNFTQIVCLHKALVKSLNLVPGKSNIIAGEFQQATGLKPPFFPSKVLETYVYRKLILYLRKLLNQGIIVTLTQYGD